MQCPLCTASSTWWYAFSSRKTVWKYQCHFWIVRTFLLFQLFVAAAEIWNKHSDECAAEWKAIYLHCTLYYNIAQPLSVKKPSWRQVHYLDNNICKPLYFCLIDPPDGLPNWCRACGLTRLRLRYTKLLSKAVYPFSKDPTDKRQARRQLTCIFVFCPTKRPPIPRRLHPLWSWWIHTNRWLHRRAAQKQTNRYQQKYHLSETLHSYTRDLQHEATVDFPNSTRCNKRRNLRNQCPSVGDKITIEDKSRSWSAVSAAVWICSGRLNRRCKREEHGKGKGVRRPSNNAASKCLKRKKALVL